MLSLSLSHLDPSHICFCSLKGRVPPLSPSVTLGVGSADLTPFPLGAKRAGGGGGSGGRAVRSHLCSKASPARCPP